MEAPLSHPPIPTQGRPLPRDRQRRTPGPTVEAGSEHDPSDSSAGPSRQTNNPRRNHRPRPPRSADQGETNEAPSRQTGGGLSEMGIGHGALVEEAEVVEDNLGPLAPTKEVDQGLQETPTELLPVMQARI
ncbi:hypothetical protein NLI96_g8023 [Meripilus lineatus]|uniref:Uncharacterized protein n=1 Tax=Meripilus lineatus TaxID=2056292 RepID=A0AAD5V018_9APHY|nr:hypothetical protein NLI96_g8023 [Physisporinus lineatus]